MRACEGAACISRIAIVMVSALCLVMFCGEKIAAQQTTAQLTGTVLQRVHDRVPAAERVARRGRWSQQGSDGSSPYECGRQLAGVVVEGVDAGE